MVAVAVLRDIGLSLTLHGGAALIVDYGHTASAPGETLQAVRDHAYHPVLTDPGDADLTAHVDFQWLSHCLAPTPRVATWGPVTQGDFLRALGIEARRDALLANANADQAKDIKGACHRLIGADEMGELFKVLALTTEGVRPSGF